MRIKAFAFNPFQTNMFVLDDAGMAVIIDPSCASPAEVEAVGRYVDSEGLSIARVLLTHAHLDHLLGCKAMYQAYGHGPELHRDDLSLYQNAATQAAMLGVSLQSPPDPVAFLSVEDVVEVGGATLSILHTPGHSPGSISFYHEPSRTVVAGDVLFAGSIGRTDLWQGSMPVLMRSIFSELIPLGDDVTVYCGHGPATTIGHERATNPFLLGAG